MFNYLNTFLDYPSKEFNVREFARIKNISPATASKILNNLAKSFLKKRAFKNLLLFKANIESEAYRDLKVYYNIRKIKDSGLIKEINNFYLHPTIILFGSMSTGHDIETSDIDLVIISEKTTILDTKPFEKKLKREIQIFAIRKLSELRNEHLINNVLNGITLQGSLEWTSVNVLKKDLSK
ncbi:nucleotidyltransferase domain-containing protein [Candidatus Woesearchaeota archaeon]|nr:nucleotidyltransferase domain-containing protein [Candidatus Woesearchaeota archaeon]